MRAESGEAAQRCCPRARARRGTRALIAVYMARFGEPYDARVMAAMKQAGGARQREARHDERCQEESKRRVTAEPVALRQQYERCCYAANRQEARGEPSAARAKIDGGDVR